MSDVPELVLDRVFAAPPERVWQAWTDPALLARWYGPNVETVIHRFELEPEGVWLNEMKMSQGASYQKVVFKEVIEPKKLVWHHFSSVDANWANRPAISIRTNGTASRSRFGARSQSCRRALTESTCPIAKLTKPVRLSAAARINRSFCTCLTTRSTHRCRPRPT